MLAILIQLSHLLTVFVFYTNPGFNLGLFELGPCYQAKAFCADRVYVHADFCMGSAPHPQNNLLDPDLLSIRFAQVVKNVFDSVCLRL